MTINYTTLLGLAKPVTGTEAGTWGDTVNDAITSLLDTAVAGATTLNTDADVTLTSTQGVANQARQAIILWTASGSVTRNITAPAASKTYIVINATGGSQSIVIRGVGPTTGVTVTAGEYVLVAWNGSDFVRVATSIANVGTTATQTLTNKRITPRANITTTTSSPWAWNSDSYDIQGFTGLANALTINADAGTPTDGQKTIFRLKDDGTARALTWTTGSSKAFRAVGITLPTTTVISKVTYVGCIYNSNADRWDAVATGTEA
jgi:hypothetical protein